MLKSKLIRLTPILLILFAATLTFSQEVRPTPTTPSAADSQPTAVVPNGDCGTVAECQNLLEQANRRVLKLIGDVDAAIAAKGANAEVIEAYKMLRDLMKEAMAVKDQMIADVKADNEFLRKDRVGKSKSWIRRFAEKVEKIALVVLGAYLGRH